MIKKVIQNIFYCLALLIISLSVFFVTYALATQKKGEVVQLFGYSYATVVSGSMEPTIKIKDTVLFKHNKFEDAYKIVNDLIKLEFDAISNLDDYPIIIFRDMTDPSPVKRLVVHRAISIALDDSGLVTKGDNNASTDREVVTANNYIGIVTSYGASFFGSTSTQTIVFTVLVIVVVAILIKEVSGIFVLVKQKKIIEEEQSIKDTQGKTLLADKEEQLRHEVLEEIKKEQEEHQNLDK